MSDIASKPWLRYYPLDVPLTIAYPDWNVADLLLKTAAEYPRHEAIDFMGRTMTYEKLLGQCRRMASGLRSLGVAKGDRVAIMLPNCPQAVIAYYGALLAGATVVQTNPLYSERELHGQLIDSGARVLVVLDLLMPRVKEAKGGTPLEHVVATSLSDALPWPKSWLYPIKRRKEYPNLTITYGKGGVIRWSAWLAQCSEASTSEAVDVKRDLAMIQYTGGTTGKPKGVMLTHANLIANTLQAAAWCVGMERGKERYLAALPLFHVFGLTVLLNQCVYMAGTLVLVPRFNTRMVLAAIRRRRPTVFPGAPTMYIAIMNDPHLNKTDLGSVSVCVSGAASLPKEVQDRFEQLSGGKLIEGYGLTEASPVTHCNPLRGYRKTRSIGVPLPDTDARIVGPDSLDPLPVGELGELAVKGPQVMAGYWRRAEETSAVLHDGWLRTGDLGMMDEEGFFTIMDRIKDVIIAGGFNVFPREVEEVLFEHPAVKEASVLGVPDEYRGETVKAYIVLKEGWQASEMQFDRWCRDRLAAYKVPRIYEFRDSLPQSIVGKVLRRKLKEEDYLK